MRGFSLVEVLAVIAIIAILSGILASAATESRKAALAVADTSLLRQLGQARAIYSSDHEGSEVRSPQPLVEAGLVPPECLRSGLDSSDVGYANLFRISDGREPLPYKVSFITQRDAERSEELSVAPQSASRRGWLIAARHGRALPYQDLVPSFFEGRYSRLCDDGSVISRDFYWHMVTVDGQKQWAVNVSRSFFDAPGGD